LGVAKGERDRHAIKWEVKYGGLDVSLIRRLLVLEVRITG
jgi:hypothetical protein